MSTVSTSAPPRWKTAIESAISQFKNQTVFQLSTIEIPLLDDAPSSRVSPLASIRPHVRSHIFRSFLSPPSHPNLPLIVTSTDIRTPKVTQIMNSGKYGIPVELAWWIEGRQQQFRISGRVVVFGGDGRVRDNQGEREGNPDFLGMQAFDSVQYDWAKKRLETFQSLSAHMKASWCRPIPGSPLVCGEEEAEKRPERVEEPKDHNSPTYKKDKENWDTALKNFALVVIEPTYVDFVDLGAIPNRRFGFERAIMDRGCGRRSSWFLDFQPRESERTYGVRQMI